MPWDGLYLNGVPVEITALPNPGYLFGFWEMEGSDNRPISPYLKIDFENDEKLTANFLTEEEINKEVFVSPNPGLNEVNVRIGLVKRTEVHFEIFNSEGKKVFESLPTWFDEGLLNHKIPISTFAPGLYLIKSHFDEKTRVSKFVKI